MSFRHKEQPRCGLDLALQWSFELLSPVEQLVLSQATVFAGGFDLAAAAAVLELTPWAHSDALFDVLEQLVSLGLLRVVSCPGRPEQLRYDVPLAVAQALVVLLEEAQSSPPGLEPQTVIAAAKLRHGAYYAALGYDQFGPGLLLGERSNLLAAVQRAIERSDTATAYGAARAALCVLQAYGPITVAQETLCDVLTLVGLSQEQREDLLRIRRSLLAMMA